MTSTDFHSTLFTLSEKEDVLLVENDVVQLSRFQPMK